MSEIDLVPRAFRQAATLRLWTTRIFIMLAALLALVALVRAGLLYMVNHEKLVLDKLKSGEAASITHRAELVNLRGRKQSAENQLKVLANLRGTPGISPLLSAIDRALNDDVWFEELKFIREGELVVATPEMRGSGYFIVPGDKATTTQAWRVQRHVQIKGQASTHSALTEFIKQLSAQARFQNVRLLSTGPGTHAAAQVVDFSLIALVNPEPAPL